MEGVCRLCCSGAGVSQDIFGECSSIYLKMSTCLPVKVSKGDQLPQKICTRCSMRLDDYYQFFSEALASQDRLRKSISIYAPDKYSDLKPDLSLTKHHLPLPTLPDLKPLKIYETKCTQTCEDDIDVKLKTITTNLPEEIVKHEPEIEVDEIADVDNEMDVDFVPSDYSDDISLKMLKKKKKKSKKEKKAEINGDVKKRKRSRKEDAENKSDNDDLEKDENFDKDFSTKERIKQEWMNFETGLLDAQFLESSLIRPDEGDNYYCCICFVQCPNKNDMISHYRSHVTEDVRDIKLELECEDGEAGSVKCKLCDKALKNKYSLEKHMLSHNDRRPYRCSLCEKTFREVNQILKHGRTHSYEAPQTTSVAECVVTDCPTALKGELCPDEHLVVRPRTHPQPLSKRFVCDLCDEGFVYMRYLMEHRNRSHPEASDKKLVNRCMHCSREFAHLNSLRRHLRSHTGERNFLCNVCGKALSSREHLKFHIRIHTGYKPNVCKTCGKGFVKKCNLTLHERVHSGEKPHVCSHCGKAFSQRSTLVIHERYHSGARPYVCTLCGKGFVAKGLLSMHLKTTCI